MSEPQDVTPERLAELADGAPPRDEAEREVMALMADVRALDDPAPDAVRERVRAIAVGRARAARACAAGGRARAGGACWSWARPSSRRSRRSRSRSRC